MRSYSILIRNVVSYVQTPSRCKEMGENESYGNVYGGAFSPHRPELLPVLLKRF